MCQLLLIAGRELKNEQATQEVGEEGAGSLLSQPEPGGEINSSRQTNAATVFRHRLLCLPFIPSLGSYIYRCTRQDFRVKNICVIEYIIK